MSVYGWALITNNSFKDSIDHAIKIDNTAGATVKYNAFYNNNLQNPDKSQAQNNGSSNFQYNYWNDWITPDFDNNGIVDKSYAIDGQANTTDPYPLILSPLFHQLTTPTVLYPNGGEIINETITISWKGSLDSYLHGVTYDLYYSIDNGSSWISLASNLVNYSYIWDTSTVPNGTTYLIKVVATDGQGLTTEDQSDATFAIQNVMHVLTTPTVTYPNGGESLTGTVTITWQASTDFWGHQVSYDLYYSPNGGSTWYLIATSLATTSYSWNTTTLPDGSTYLIKVVATDGQGLTTEDQSDATFEIRNAPPTNTTTTTTTPTTTTTTITRTTTTQSPSSPTTTTSSSSPAPSDSSAVQTESTTESSAETSFIPSTIVVNTSGFTTLSSIVVLVSLSILTLRRLRKDKHPS